MENKENYYALYNKYAKSPTTNNFPLPISNATPANRINSETPTRVAWEDKQTTKDTKNDNVKFLRFELM